jgi:hypothetical protein
MLKKSGGVPAWSPAEKAVRHGLFANEPRPHIPAAVLEDRDRRAGLQPTTLNQLVLGDPLPGRSALDSRRR